MPSSHKTSSAGTSISSTREYLVVVEGHLLAHQVVEQLRSQHAGHALASDGEQERLEPHAQARHDADEEEVPHQLQRLLSQVRVVGVVEHVDHAREDDVRARHVGQV